VPVAIEVVGVGGMGVVAGADLLAERLARILKVAVWVGVGLLIAGAALAFARDGQLPVEPPPLTRVPAEAAAFEPAGLLTLGVLVLLAGPIAGVVYLLAAFIARHERRYALVSALLLAILATSGAIALLTGGE
jgi:uncharacterized membrane protein